MQAALTADGGGGIKTFTSEEVFFLAESPETASTAVLAARAGALRSAAPKTNRAHVRTHHHTWWRDVMVFCRRQAWRASHCGGVRMRLPRRVCGGVLCWQVTSPEQHCHRRRRLQCSGTRWGGAHRWSPASSTTICSGRCWVPCLRSRSPLCARPWRRSCSRPRRVVVAVATWTASLRRFWQHRATPTPTLTATTTTTTTTTTTRR